MPIFLFLFLLSLTVFCVLSYFERRNLLIAISFLMTVGTGLLTLVATGFFDNHSFISFSLLAFIALVFLGILSGPFLLMVTLYYNGFKVIRREGAHLHNFLSLGLALAITLYFSFFPILEEQLAGIGFFSILYVYVGLLIFYLVSLVILFILASFINLVHVFPKKLDYIVVLGAGLNGDEVTPLLASRINKGIKVYQKNPGSKLIMSGGKGTDEVIAEGQAMANYALKQGVPESDLILECQSRNTRENLHYSSALMPRGSQFALVTSYYHLFRALTIARIHKLKCIGYGARTKFYFTLNAFIREFIGYMVITRRKHIIMLALITVLYLVALALNLYLTSQGVIGK